MKQTLSYTQRLHNGEEFGRALKKKALIDKWLAVHWEQNTKETDCLGIVITKRTIPKATERNRIKRQIRELFRTSRYDSVNSLNIVVRVRKSVLAEEIKDFRQAMIGLFMKVRQIENDSPIPPDHKGLSILH